MGIVTCYRIDFRNLEIGKMINSPGDHIDRLTPELLRAEQMLRASSPLRRAQRSSSLYAFSNLTRAQKYYLGKQGWLYELEVDEADIVHRADMLIVNRIATATDEEAPALVGSYWAKGQADGDWMEILMTTAKVKARLFGPGDKVQLKQRLYG